eukprot:TRINITY_DN16992_c0_g1_i1.p1 TRINITY_DN16992_c0_g1~~TRINITY_DN16992_c0_g1_i1.p1  ORF type:complete len:760 (-),score=153.80 TRINITY_DN16992_c0_g1_i1:79-2331(-)
MPGKRQNAPRGHQPAAGAVTAQTSNPEPPPTMPELPAWEKPVGFLVLLTALLVYHATLHPSVAGGDAGELMTVAHELGTAHPPGYPSFTMFSKAAEVVYEALVRDGTGCARGMNLGHAVLSSFATMLLFFAGTRLTGSLAAGVLSGILFGFSPAVWTYAVVTEVFPLNNFFVSLLLLLCVQFYRSHCAQSPGLESVVSVSAFVAGLASTNQHTVVIYLLPIIPWVFILHRRHLTWRRFWKYTALFALGASPYLYLNYSAVYVKSKQSWGDMLTLDGWLTHVLRREYGTFSLASKESQYRVRNFANAFHKYFLDLRVQTLGVLWLLSVVGILAALRDAVRLRLKRVDVRLLFVLTYSFYLCFFHALCNLPLDNPLFLGVQQRFWIQPLTITTLLIGSGFHEITRWIGGHFFSASGKPEGAKIPVQHLHIMALILAASIAGAQIRLNYWRQDESGNFIVRDFGWTILQSLPKNAILLTKGDLIINSARFVQSCEGFRPDVRIVDQEMLTYYWYVNSLRHNYPDVVFPNKFYYPGKKDGFSIRQFLDANLKKNNRTVFLCHGWKDGDPTYQGVYKTRPWGVATQVIPQNHDYTAKSLNKYIERTRNALPRNVSLPPQQHRFPDHAWELVVERDYWSSVQFQAYYLLTISENPPARATTENVHFLALNRSVEIYRDLFERQPHPNHLVYRNFGVALQEWLRYFPKDVWATQTIAEAFEKYLRLPEGQNDQQRKVIEDAVRYYQNLLAGLLRESE